MTDYLKMLKVNAVVEDDGNGVDEGVFIAAGGGRQTLTLGGFNRGVCDSNPCVE